MISDSNFVSSKKGGLGDVARILNSFDCETRVEFLTCGKKSAGENSLCNDGS